MKEVAAFQVKAGSSVKLDNFDPQFADKHETKHSALPKVEDCQRRMDELQYRLYADQRRSLLICIQAPDAGGKDGVVRASYERAYEDLLSKCSTDDAPWFIIPPTTNGSAT